MQLMNTVKTYYKDFPDSVCILTTLQRNGFAV